MRLCTGKRTILIIIISLMIVVSYNFSLLAADNTAVKSGDVLSEKSKVEAEDGWKVLVVDGEMAKESYQYYQKLFKEENFPLIGKLMTVFLVEEEKAYIINEVDRDNKQNSKVDVAHKSSSSVPIRFNIQSRNTIQDGSYIDILSMNKDGFSFKGRLKIRKVFSFVCDIRVKVSYKVEGDGVSYTARTEYIAPTAVNGLNSVFSVFAGQDYISYKLLNFIDNLHLVLSRLSILDRDDWYLIADNEERLSSLVYPVTFSKKEKKLVAGILDE